MFITDKSTETGNRLVIAEGWEIVGHLPRDVGFLSQSEVKLYKSVKTLKAMACTVGELYGLRITPQ